jgi:hypothetical protein
MLCNHNTTDRCLECFADFALQFAARTTDLARLLEAMRRDAVDAESYACYLNIRVFQNGGGSVSLGHGEPATFDTIEAGVAKLQAVIDDAEEGEPSSGNVGTQKP